MYSTPRFINQNDLPKLLELYKYLHSGDQNIVNDSIKSAWEQIINSNKFIKYIVIEKDSQFLSSCCIALIPNLTRNGRPYALIENVITHPDFRRKGLASTVINMAIQYAENNNCYKVMLLSNSSRKEAHQFYTAIGFSSDKKIGFIKSL